jgi:hypothetical protein
MKECAAVFGLLTLLLRPWRNIVCQDDGGYAVSALQLAHGTYRPHPLSLSSQWVQFSLATVALKILPFLPSLAVLNLMTWFVFLSVIVLACRGTSWNWRIIASFFLVPLWAQYGASFLYEVYDAFLVAGLILLLESTSPRIEPKLKTVLIFLIACLLPLQQQTLAAFPFGWGVVSLARRKWKSENFALLGGTLFGLLIYALIPKGSMQASFFLAQLAGWKSMNVPIYGAALMLKLVCGTGLFLLPLLDLEMLKRRYVVLTLAAQIGLFGFFCFSGTSSIGVGVLFMDYLPRAVDLGFVSFGVWGLWVLVQAWKQNRQTESSFPVSGTLLALLAMLTFNTFRMVNDIRYMMIVAIPVFFGLKSYSPKVLGAKTWVMAALFAVALIANLYNLNTNQARWEIAASLEAAGIPAQDISAGYGRDSFTLGFDCAGRALEKLSRESNRGATSFNRFLETVYAYNTRIYELGWQPREVIKPAIFFGRHLSLNQHSSELQEQAPKRVVPYTVLGIPQVLAVYESDKPRTAWCFE